MQFYSGLFWLKNTFSRSFATDCKKEAEKRAIQKGLKVQWGENSYMKTKCYISGFEYVPMLDQNVLYSAIADHSAWFDAWPTVAEKPYIKQSFKYFKFIIFDFRLGKFQFLIKTYKTKHYIT